MPYVDAKNLVADAGEGREYAYRRIGVTGARPLLLLQHFRGNMENWDPALVDMLADAHDVIVFDNVGVGGSAGRTPSTIEEMALDALAFLDALGLRNVDVLGFSIGSFIAQEIALIRPDAVNRLVLASAAPRGAPGMHGWTADVIGAIGEPTTAGQDFMRIFFTGSAESSEAGQAFFQRISARTEDRDPQTSWETRQAQYDAIVQWGIPRTADLERVTAIRARTFVANGDSDPMVLPRYSHLLAGLIPDASIKIYPDAAHGFLFQHHGEFAADVKAFLSE